MIELFAVLFVIITGLPMLLNAYKGGKSFHSPRRKESGQGLVEYALILVLVAIVCIAIIAAVGGLKTGSGDNLLKIYWETPYEPCTVVLPPAPNLTPLGATASRYEGYVLYSDVENNVIMYNFDDLETRPCDEE